MIIKLAIAAAGIAATIVAPVQAQDNSAAATQLTSAQITGVIEAPVASGTGDAEFSELFASWQQADAGRVSAATGFVTAPVQRVAVPSRMPLDAARMSSNYGMRAHPVLGRRRQHNGVDLAAPTGTPVYAPADGLVSRADAWGSYGNYIALEHGGDLQTRFGHLSGFAVSAGERVSKGQLIGYVGSTGRSTGPHLHYEVRVAGEPVDPRPYMLDAGNDTRVALVAGQGGMGGGD
ncbi:M23 family metallopeptidase [Croceibacterium ferulae]|uniref:M23 family metallopeptidase n=1 Tax=Croceibacterium ferulae TaxID=1854641 RepID=UPI000EAED7CC|nr:M23 family metallopeptidase [Croceibacterium ferulae]